MSARFAASNKVAIVGYAHSQVTRHADKPLGVLAVDTARAAIADAGLRLEQIDGFVSSSLLPSAGGRAAEDGVSIVSSAWLAQHLGATSRYVAGFDGIGQITGSMAIAVNAVASWRCRLCGVPSRPAQSRWAVSRQPHARNPGDAAMDGTPGLLSARWP